MAEKSLFQNQSRQDPGAANDDLSFELRRSVNNAYAFVSGAQQVQSFAGITIEECLDQQIEIISGEDTVSRPNILHRLDKIENDIKQAASKIKSLNDDFFKVQNPEDNVNTEPSPAAATTPPEVAG